MDYIIHNGELIKKSEASISIFDKGYFFDFAVYSSLKVIQGKIFFPEYHVDGLFESAEVIDLGHNFTKKEVLEWLNLMVEKNQIRDAFLRIMLIGDADENKNAKLYIFPITGVTYYPNSFYTKGVKVITYKGERLIPKSKTKNLLLGFLALREANKKDAVEALLVDREGNVREGTRSNFFAIKDDTLITPPKEKVLEGITKKIIFQLASEQFKISEEDIPLSKIKENYYDEFFISSTLFNVLPINQIDDTRIESNFEKTKIVRLLFKEHYHKSVLEKNTNGEVKQGDG